ncbi:MAG: protein-L-isoaspartate O-methyltransferase [Pseudomonadota bacterium]
MELERARHNMIEQQIRPWEVLDQHILDLLGRVRREDFVPEAYQTLAFADIEIPLGHGEAMWPPKIEARVLQSLDVQPGDRVLEVGTGSGYLTALLASLASEVVSVEIEPELKASAEQKLAAHGFSNIRLELGDGARGWERGAPYDVIVLTGSTPVLPDALLRQLKLGGRLFAVVGEPPVMQARLITRTGEAAWRTDVLFETVIKALRNASQPERFVF